MLGIYKKIYSMHSLEILIIGTLLVIQLEIKTYLVRSKTDIKSIVSLEAIWDFVLHQQWNCQIGVSYCSLALCRICIHYNYGIHMVVP